MIVIRLLFSLVGFRNGKAPMDKNPAPFLLASLCFSRRILPVYASGGKSLKARAPVVWGFSCQQAQNCRAKSSARLARPASSALAHIFHQGGGRAAGPLREADDPVRAPRMVLRHCRRRIGSELGAACALHCSMIICP